MHIEPAFTVAIGNGLGTFRYSATDADAVGRHLFWTGLSQWEHESWREFIPLARKARGFLDVGAFTGCYSLVAATANPSLRALAFEPVPGVYDRLTTNIAINNLSSRVTAIPAAVSNSNGTERFFIPDRAMPDTGFLQSSLRQSEEAGTWHHVQTTTIESALPGGFDVDLVKIDVEDAEGPVVESMRDVLAHHRPTIFIEFLATGSYQQAGAVLAELDYEHLPPHRRRPRACDTTPACAPRPVHQLPVRPALIPSHSVTLSGPCRSPRRTHFPLHVRCYPAPDPLEARKSGCAY